MKSLTGNNQLGLDRRPERRSKAEKAKLSLNKNLGPGCKSPRSALGERGKEVFFLDILSHRMSAMAILHQLLTCSNREMKAV
jgi:hypothetical protein